MARPMDKKMKMILRLFPYLKNINNASKLLIDDESVHYISIREYAEKISDIIKTRLSTINISKEDAIITDATAGVGGDTISFSKNFKWVYAIEINKLRSEYLKNNAEIYECNNITIINDDSTNLLNKIDNHNVIFIDPPWEPNNNGSYKQYQNLRLPFGEYMLEDICNKLMDKTYMKKVPELIVLKLPKNYDIIYFYNNIKGKKIYYYDLNKMIILIIMVS
jgi:16S rRNA G966 N2-methylase RsmD